MRVLLSTYGTRGDVEPIAALAVQLRDLGAQVRVCAPSDEEFVELFRRVGVPLVPFEKSWGSWATGPSTAAERVTSVDEFVAGYIAATYDTLVTEAEWCDVLLATGMLHFVAGSVAEKVGVPHRFVVFAPVLDMPARDAAVGAPIDTHRSSIGLPPVDDVHEFLFTGRPWVATDATLSTWQEDPDLEIVRTGAWILPDERPLPDDLLRFLGTGAPPVYVGFGSMRVPDDSVRAVVAAIRGFDRRVVLRADQSVGDRGDDCFTVAEVNQQALFPRVAAVVHHGGAGTTATAARAGAAQVVIPQAADQSYWAARVVELGIGSTPDGPGAGSVTAALRTALRPETRTRAGTVAGQIRTDGTRVAAEMLMNAATR